jgi:hypothetical protein
VNWFFKFFKKKDEDVFAFSDKEVPASTVVRWFIYDTSLDDENAIAQLLGLTRVSEEGDTKEREDSDYRLLAIKELFPYIEHMSELSAEIVTLIQLQSIEKSKSADLEQEKEQLFEDLAVMKLMYKAVAASALLGGLSIAMRLGLINEGKVTLSKIDLEGDK